MKKRFNGLLRAMSVWLVCLIVLGSSLSAGAVGQSAQGECAIYKKYDLPTRSIVTLASFGDSGDKQGELELFWYSEEDRDGWGEDIDIWLYRLNDGYYYLESYYLLNMPQRMFMLLERSDRGFKVVKQIEDPGYSSGIGLRDPESYESYYFSESWGADALQNMGRVLNEQFAGHGLSFVYSSVSGREMIASSIAGEPVLHVNEDTLLFEGEGTEEKAAVSKEGAWAELGIFDFAQLDYVAKIEEFIDGEDVVIDVYFENGVNLGGSDGYVKEWITSQGILSDMEIDIDGDGADEYIALYVRPVDTYEEYRIAIFEAKDGRYVKQEDFQCGFDMIGFYSTRTLRILETDEGMRLASAEESGSYFNSAIFSYDGSKAYIEFWTVMNLYGTSYALKEHIPASMYDFLREKDYAVSYYSDSMSSIYQGKVRITDSNHVRTRLEAIPPDGKITGKYIDAAQKCIDMAAECGMLIGMRAAGSGYYSIEIQNGTVIALSTESVAGSDCDNRTRMHTSVRHINVQQVESEPESDIPDVDWNNPSSTIRSKGYAKPQNGTMLDGSMLGKVVWVEDSVGGWFRMVAPQSGDYVFWVLAPDLPGNSFNIAINVDGMTAAWLNYKRSDEVQTGVLRNVQKGQLIEWWNEDGKGRGYTLQSRFRMMITAGPGSGVADTGGTAAKTGTVYVNNDSNIRSGPGLSYEVLGTIFAGGKATWLGESSTDNRGVMWYKIRSAKGTVGWISSRYTQLKSGGAEVALSFGTLLTGSKGERVVELQEMLAALGYHYGACDGAYGGQTAASVKRFQSDYGLRVTGEANEATWNALKRAISPQNEQAEEQQPEAEQPEETSEAESGQEKGFASEETAQEETPAEVPEETVERCPHDLTEDTCCVCRGCHDWQTDTENACYVCSRCGAALEFGSEEQLYFDALNAVPEGANPLYDPFVEDYLMEHIWSELSEEMKFAVYMRLREVPQVYRDLYFYTVSEYKVSKYMAPTDEKRFKHEESPNGKDTIFINEEHPDYAAQRELLGAWFHEVGHAIDANFATGGSAHERYLSMRHSGQSKPELYTWMYNDMYSVAWDAILWVAEGDEEIGLLTQEEMVEVVKALLNPQAEKQFADEVMTRALEWLKREVVAQVQESLKAEGGEVVMKNSQLQPDAWGGITNNYVGVYTNREYGAFGGHGVSYEIWNAGGIYTDEDGKQQKADSKDLHYWFDKDYQPTYAQCREVFAEFYSAMMMGDEEIIASAERMFPHSVEYMERMAGELLREYKSRHK